MGRGRTAAGLGLVVTTTVFGGREAGAGGAQPVVGRSAVETKYDIFAAGQPLPARAGVPVLERQGNAVDATIRRLDPTGNGARSEERLASLPNSRKAYLIDGRPAGVLALVKKFVREQCLV